MAVTTEHPRQLFDPFLKVPREWKPHVFPLHCQQIFGIKHLANRVGVELALTGTFTYGEKALAVAIITLPVGMGWNRNTSGVPNFTNHIGCALSSHPVAVSLRSVVIHLPQQGVDVAGGGIRI